MKKKHLNSIIRKSYLKDGKISIVLIMIVLVSSILISLFSGLLISIEEVHRDEARDKYGTYQFGVMNIDEQQAMDIFNMNLGKKSSVFASEYITFRNSGFYKIYADKEFWEISNFNIVIGKEPLKNGEVVCNETFLVSLGYEEKDIDSEIKIGQDKYILKGIISSEKDYKDEYTIILPITSIGVTDSINYAVMIEGNTREYGHTIKDITKEYDIPSSKIFVNKPFQDYVGKDENNEYIGIMKTFNYFRYMVAIPCVMLTISVAIFYCRKVSMTCKTYFSYGLSKFKVYGVLWSYIIFIILTVSVIGLLISCFFITIYIHINSVITKETVVYIIKNLLMINMYYVVGNIIGFSIIFIIRWILLGDRTYLKRKKGTSVFVSNKDNIYMRLSIENKNFGIMRHLIIVLMLSVTCAVTSGMGYFMKQYIKSNSSTEKYDYLVKIRHYNFAEEIEGSNECNILYNKVLKSKEINDVLPIYKKEKNILIGKTTLDSGYLKYLSGLSDYYADAINGNETKLYIPVIVIGMNNQIASKLGISYDIESIKKNECIILKYTSAPGNNYGYETGIKNGDEIVFDGMEDTGEYLIVDEIEKYDTSLLNDYYTQVIIVNFDNYKDFVKYSYPESFYVNASNSYELTRSIKSIQRFEVTDLKEKKRQVAEYNRTVILTKNITFILMLVLISTVTAITSYLGYFAMKRQAATMYAMGISMAKISKIFYGDILRIYENTCFLGIITSIASTYYVYYVLGKDMFFYKYAIPLKEVLTPLFLIGISLIVSVITVYWIISRMDVVGTLRNDVN